MTLVKFSAADYSVWNCRADEDIFKGSGLRVGSVEDRDVSIGDCVITLILTVNLVDFIGNELSLIVRRVSRVANNLFAIAGRGPKVFGWSIKVI